MQLKRKAKLPSVIGWLTTKHASKSFLGSYFIYIYLESIYSGFALFDCFGAILYELLIAGLMDQVYQSDAYEVLPVVLVNRGKRDIYFRGTEENSHFLGEHRQYLGEGNIRKQIFDLGEKKQDYLFQRNKGTGIPPPPCEDFVYH